jgi:hypothetical protein
MTSDEESTMDDQPRIAPRIPLRELEPDPATLEPAAPAPMQRGVDPAVGTGPQWRNAPAGAATSSYVPVGVMALLAQFTWVHELDGTKECGGCANDGEPGYCQGAGPGWDQQDTREGDELDQPPPILCHCGHRVVAVARGDTCECSGPGAWHCDGEDSQHWAKGEAPDAECGHCGAEGRQLDQLDD